MADVELNNRDSQQTHASSPRRRGSHLIKKKWDARLRGRDVLFVCVSALLLLFLTFSVHAQSFHGWIENLRAEAIASGISQRTLDRVLSSVELDHDVIKYDRKQPEKRIDLAQYQKRVLTESTIARGRELYREHYSQLAHASRVYGVEPEYIMALWGIETRFGDNTGNFQIIPSLLTLAYEGRRGDFFRHELIEALRMIDEGEVQADDFFGSWAGATGQCQFMPSTYSKYAADGDGDGKRDIWNNTADVFASIASYLRAEGWQAGYGWGRQVKLTRPIPKATMSREIQLGYGQWNAQGVRNMDGSILVELEQRGGLVRPDDGRHRVFLVNNNFNALMRWNKSLYFAITAGMLAEAIAERN